jgi:heat shock protein HtpX
MTSTLKTGLLLGALTALMILLGGAIGGQGGVMIAFVLAVLTNVFSYWFSDKLVLRMYRAQEVGPEHPLTRVVARLAQKAGLPMPKCYVIPDMSPNAFATGRSPEHAAVAATEGILRLLPENELEGVIAHELSHVKNRDILISTVAATLAAAIMFLGYMARWGAFFAGTGSSDDRRGANPIALLAMALLAPFAAMLIQMAVSRQREYAADRSGATLVGSPTGLANALRRIDSAAKQIPLEDATPATAHLFIMNPFTRPGLMSLFQTHPPTEARIKALMEMRPGQ